MAPLEFLGRAASEVRAHNLDDLLDSAVDRADRLFAIAGVFPLSTKINGRRLRGGLRHRSFLSSTRGGYEPYLRQLIGQHLQRGWSFIDAGAHIGIQSVYASKLVGPEGRVYAFEPDPYNFAALVRNTRGLNNVLLTRSAVGAETGSAPFTRSRGTISNSLIRRPDVVPLDIQNVPVISIDSINPGRRVLIKLDIEGAELLAIMGMEQTVRKADDVVVIAEVSRTALEAAGESPLTLIEALEHLGLVVSSIEDGYLIPARDAPLDKGNLYCVRGLLS